MKVVNINQNQSPSFVVCTPKDSFLSFEIILLNSADKTRFR